MPYPFALILMIAWLSGLVSSDGYRMGALIHNLIHNLLVVTGVLVAVTMSLDSLRNGRNIRLVADKCPEAVITRDA